MGLLQDVLDAVNRLLQERLSRMLEELRRLSSVTSQGLISGSSPSKVLLAVSALALVSTLKFASQKLSQGSLFFNFLTSGIYMAKRIASVAFGPVETMSRDCAICGGQCDNWPAFVMTPFIGPCGKKTMPAHLKCLKNNFLEDPRKEKNGHEQNLEFKLEDTFKTNMELVLELSPGIAKTSCVRISHEEHRLLLAATNVSRFPPEEPPVPPPILFELEGLQEIRISSTGIASLPTEIGVKASSLRSLVLISNGITSLPDEVGLLIHLVQLFLNGNLLRFLPQSVGALPVLEELCLDSNRLEALPDYFVSEKLSLFSAPANQLQSLPALNSKSLCRIEVQGNNLLSPLFAAAPRAAEVRWDQLRTLKLMGNRLTSLPDEIGLMTGMNLLLIAGNFIKALPDSITNIPKLEWLFAYSNCLEELPRGLLMGSKWIERVLLESNPLSATCLDQLIEEAKASKIKALGLDSTQVQTLWQHRGDLKDLPESISAGDMVAGDLSPQFYMKLLRASQLRRKPEEQIAGVPGGPPSSTDEPAETLIVAFAASQGEPEWLGALRRLSVASRVFPFPESEISPLSSLLTDPDSGLSPEAVLPALWSKCLVNRESTSNNGFVNEARSLPLKDFDVLCVVDHRMRWYSEDIEPLTKALAAVTTKRRKVLFVGASMGGFGALLHGGQLADAALVFGPQARLDQATLRPPAESLEALAGLYERCCRSVKEGNARGACLEVHCAADEHCWHGLSFPLEDLRLTVHPLVPRKPFARLLDRAGVLESILSDAVYRLQVSDTPSASTRQVDSGDVNPRVVVARWSSQGTVSRFWATRSELLPLMFGPSTGNLPRPGDWYCGRCRRRNMQTNFWCTWTRPTDRPASPAGNDQESESEQENASEKANFKQYCGGTVAEEGVGRIPGARDYPRTGDWGCGKCGQACCAFDKFCSKCWSTPDHRHAFIVQ